MKLLIFGASGMLGKALTKKAKNRSYEVYCAADQGSEIFLDVRNDSEIISLIERINPDIIINTIAIVNLSFCEDNPAESYRINTRPSGIISDICRKKDIYLIHISTDHYFINDGNKIHSESDKVTLVNEYARTKYLAEKLVENWEKSLIIRTNIVGYKNDPKSPTFVEWTIKILKEKIPSDLFTDYFTSSIDVLSFSDIILDLAEKKVLGLLNVASRDVFSKRDFVVELAKALELDYSHTRPSSIKNMKGIERAESLGLNVFKVEEILGYNMPTFSNVIQNLAKEFKESEKL